MKLDLSKLTDKPLLLVAAEEEFLRRAALESIISKHLESGDAFDMETLNADSAPITDWVGRGLTLPFLSDRRLVIIRHVARVTPPKNEAGLAGLPKEALMVLVADDEQADEDRQRRFASAIRDWAKLVKECGGVVFDQKPTDADRKRWIRGAFADRGKKIDDASIAILLEICGNDLSRAIDECEKIALFAGERESVSPSDIRKVVVPAFEYNVNRLVGAILDGNPNEALQQLRLIVGSHPRPENIAFSRIFPSMNRQLRSVWQARSLIEGGSTARERLPAKNSILSEPDWAQQRAQRMARRTSFETLTRLYTRLMDADAAIKGMSPSYSTAETLELMVLTMAADAKPRPTR